MNHLLKNSKKHQKTSSDLNTKNKQKQITSSAMIFKSNIINFRNNTANHKNQHIFNSNNGIYSNLRSFENSDDINNLEYGKKQLNELNNHNSIEEKETKGDEFSINTDQNLLSNNYNTYNNNNSNVIFTNYNKRVMIISSRNVKNQKNNSINNISNNSNIILNKKILNDSNALHKSKSSKYENSELVNSNKNNGDSVNNGNNTSRTECINNIYNNVTPQNKNLNDINQRCRHKQVKREIYLNNNNNNNGENCNLSQKIRQDFINNIKKNSGLKDSDENLNDNKTKKLTKNITKANCRIKLKEKFNEIDTLENMNNKNTTKNKRDKKGPILSDNVDILKRKINGKESIASHNKTNCDVNLGNNKLDRDSQFDIKKQEKIKNNKIDSLMQKEKQIKKENSEQQSEKKLKEKNNKDYVCFKNLSIPSKIKKPTAQIQSNLLLNSSNNNNLLNNNNFNNTNGIDIQKVLFNKKERIIEPIESTFINNFSNSKESNNIENNNYTRNTGSNMSNKSNKKKIIKKVFKQEILKEKVTKKKTSANNTNLFDNNTCGNNNNNNKNIQNHNELYFNEDELDENTTSIISDKYNIENKRCPTIVNKVFQFETGCSDIFNLYRMNENISTLSKNQSQKNIQSKNENITSENNLMSQGNFNEKTPDINVIIKKNIDYNKIMNKKRYKRIMINNKINIKEINNLNNEQFLTKSNSDIHYKRVIKREKQQNNLLNQNEEESETEEINIESEKNISRYLYKKNVIQIIVVFCDGESFNKFCLLNKKIYKILKPKIYEKIKIMVNINNKFNYNSKIKRKFINFSPLSKLSPVLLQKKYLDLLYEKNNTYDVEIRKDLTRTFPDNILFKYGGNYYNKLYHLLTAYSNYNKNIGYVQGLNFLAANIIYLFESEVEEFVFLDALIKKYDFDNLLGVSSDSLSKKLESITNYINKKLPKVSEYFYSIKLNFEIFTTNWVLTLFANSMDKKFLFYVWDFMIIFGWKFLKCFIVAVLKNFEQIILGYPQHQLNVLMKNIMKSDEFNLKFKSIVSESIEYMLND